MKNDLKAEELLSRWRILLQKKSGFFSYLALFLKFEEKDDKFWEGSNSLGLGVDPSGNLFYKKSFIESLSDDNGIGVLVHEIMHLATLSLVRSKGKDRQKFNIASDIAINEILKENKFTLPKGVIWTNDKHEVKLFDKTPFVQTIKDCGMKTSEELYDEIKIPDPQVISGVMGKDGKFHGDDGNTYEFTGFDQLDDHIEGKMSQEEKEKKEKEWMGKVQEAYIQSKLRGENVLGIERLIGRLTESKVAWKTLLQRYIQSYLINDFTYQKPSKRSVACDYFLPDVLKEGIEVVIAIDTSGSIGQEELTQFLTEVVALSRAYQNNIKMTLITCDCKVQDIYEVANGSISKILAIKIRGGGGTSHVPIFDILKDKYKRTKVAVFLTDGYSDIESIKLNKFSFAKIFVISKDGNEGCIDKRYAKIIKLK